MSASVGAAAGGEGRVPSPDFVVVTASTPTQASIYRELIRARAEAGLYPPSVVFRVFCDPQQGRVGSGGGTMLALHALLELEGGKSANAPPLSGRAEAFFASKRVLLLHAGGESRRLPCYVPEGKLFAPLSMPSPSDFAPVVLDVLLSLYFGYPWRRGEVVVASGDVRLQHDRPSPSSPASALSRTSLVAPSLTLGLASLLAARAAGDRPL